MSGGPLLFQGGSSAVIKNLGQIAANLGEAQFVVFWDYAHVASKQFVPSDVNKLNASSVGAGL